MAYSTLDDILDQLEEQRVLELTDDDGVGMLDGVVVDRAIADADAEIDGYCANRFTVPFAQTPPRLRAISVDIAIYNLFSRRHAVPEERRTRYEDATKYLDKIARGLASPGVQPIPAPPGDDDIAGAVQVATRDKKFGPDTMDKF